MGRELKRLKRRKKLLAKIEEILENASTAMVIHYSCESFCDKANGKTSRITSIAVRNFESGQTESFSIHQIAEERKIDISGISGHYDDMETEMLRRYFDFVNIRQHCTWVHWNMRDVNYGFAAIEHRYRVLGGEPILIPEDRKFDLARALVSIYGVGYIGHPRLEKIVKKNKISDLDFLKGADEAEAFENKEFINLHRSTLRKVDVLANLFERTSNFTLEVNSTWREQYGVTPAVIGELIKEHWITASLITLGGLLTVIIRVFELWDLFNGCGGWK